MTSAREPRAEAASSALSSNGRAQFKIVGDRISDAVGNPRGQWENIHQVLQRDRVPEECWRGPVYDSILNDTGEDRPYGGSRNNMAAAPSS